MQPEVEGSGRGEYRAQVQCSTSPPPRAYGYAALRGCGLTTARHPDELPRREPAVTQLMTRIVKKRCRGRILCGPSINGGWFISESRQWDVAVDSPGRRDPGWAATEDCSISRMLFVESPPGIGLAVLSVIDTIAINAANPPAALRLMAPPGKVLYLLIIYPASGFADTGPETPW